MSKATEQNDKLKRAIIVSAVLHVILFAALIWSSFDEHIDASAGGGGGSSIDAVMVDPGAVVQNYNRQQKQKASAKRAEEQREKQAQQQAEELREKQAAEQERLKQLEKERLQAQEAAKEQAQQQKQAEEAAKKAQEQQKQAEEAAAKAAADAKAQADAQAKLAAEAAKKAAAAAGVDDLLGDLSSGKNAPKTGGGAKGNNAAPTGSGNTKSNGATGAEINGYAAQIKSAIESRFYDASSYTGKTCTLRIKLAPDGMLLDIKSEGGDPALCTAALAAARQAKMPKPPSQAVYEVFKNAPLDFKP